MSKSVLHLIKHDYEFFQQLRISDKGQLILALIFRFRVILDEELDVKIGRVFIRYKTLIKH